ncbi:major facilitator superfamily domain-containing protein [Xylariales sp. PMI_506]|nr:major facilitator superfamily domain-containing protein [Xylariales sp. PMI_506]
MAENTLKTNELGAVDTEKQAPCLSGLSDSNKAQSTTETIPLTDEATLRRLRRRFDMRVLPPLFAIFVMSFLDRGNIGNAKIQGMLTSLGMKGQDYSIALFMFFIPYILLEVPSNLILKKFRPATWLSFVVTCWGIVTIGQGLVRNFPSLVGLRVVLGIFEAGLFPGGAYLMSAYYARYELQWRFTVFVSSTTISGAFGGLLAYGLAKMDGIGGLEGWRWIFVIEGLLTVVVGIACFWWVTDWPDKASFMSTADKIVLAEKLAADAGGGARMDTLNKSAWKRILSDWKIWVGIVMHLSIVTSVYSVAFFLPTVITEMGFSAAEAQLRVIPVYLSATIVALTCAWATDRYQRRYLLIMTMLIPGIVGWAILLGGLSVPTGGRYFACFLICISGNTVLPTVLAWVNYQVSGNYKRAITSAMVIGLGNSGGIVGSNIWLTKEAPTYVTGVSVALTLMVLCGIMATVFYFGLKRENEKRERGERDYRFGYEASEVDNLGDDHPNWRFTF